MPGFFGISSGVAMVRKQMFLIALNTTRRHPTQIPIFDDRDNLPRSRQMKLTKRAMWIVAVFVDAALTVTVFAEANKPPSQASIDFAKRASDLMFATMLAALLQEFAETTPANVQEGIQSIGLIFNDHNTNMRLVGTFQPLSDNDYPKDTFEEAALAQAMTGQAVTKVERINGDWFYRRSVPLSNFHPACVMCHTNFGSVPSNTEMIGALMLKVPIK